MSTSNSAFLSVSYVNPFAAPPPGVTQSGIIAQADTSKMPAGMQDPVFVIRLRNTSNPTTIGTSSTTGVVPSRNNAVYQPPFPLSATEGYMIDGMWVERNTADYNIQWGAAVSSSPVSTSMVWLDSAEVESNVLTAQVSFGTQNANMAARLNVYSLANGMYVLLGSADSFNSETITLEIPENTENPSVYFLDTQVVIPTEPAVNGAISAPFSLGPRSAMQGIPAALTAFTEVHYNGSVLQVGWNTTPEPNQTWPDGSLVDIVQNGSVIHSLVGGPTGAIFPLDVEDLENLEVQVRTLAGTISSEPVSSPVITEAPEVSEVSFSIENKVTGTVTTPAGADNVQVALMDGDRVLANPVPADQGIFNIAYAGLNRVGLTVIAYGTATNGLLSGPSSTPAIVLATAPVVTSVVIQSGGTAENAVWEVALDWQDLPDAPEDLVSYTVKIAQGKSVLNAPTLVHGTQSNLVIKKDALDPAKPTELTLFATSANGGTSPMAVVPLFFTPALLTLVVSTAQSIEARWQAGSTPPTPAPVSYQMALADTDGNVLFAAEPTRSLSGSIPREYLPLNQVSDPVVLVHTTRGQVTLLSDVSMGDKVYATPILEVPAWDAVETTDPYENQQVIHWVEVEGATGYTGSVSTGDTFTNQEALSFALTAATIIGDQVTYQVQAVGVSNGVPVSGPLCEPRAVPSQATHVADVHYDGTTATVWWQEVAGALDYEVFVYATTQAPPVQSFHSPAELLEYSFLFTASDPNETYEVLVIANMPNGQALSGNRVDLFTPGYYLSQEPASTALPYLYPAHTLADLGTASAAPTARVLEAYLPELAATAGGVDLSNLPTPSVFTLEASQENPALPYKLTLAADDAIWSFGTDAIRGDLKEQYNTFLSAVETGGATPFGIHALQESIARLMPQTFGEALYYAYGFTNEASNAAATVDLRPGMVLRVTLGSFQNLGQYNTGDWVQGYAGSAVFDYEIGSYQSGGTWRAGFDAFLSELSAQGALSVTAPSTGTNSAQSGMASAADLYFSQFVQPFYRLFIPSQLVNPTSGGTNSTQGNFTLSAASSYSNLQATTNNNANATTAYFRGRATVQVMIKILVNGVERLVPVGTRVRNVLEQLGLRAYGSSPVLESVRLFRSLGGLMTSPHLMEAMGPQMEINMSWDGLAVYALGNGLDALAVPLLPGDELVTSADRL